MSSNLHFKALGMVQYGSWQGNTIGVLVWGTFNLVPESGVSPSPHLPLSPSPPLRVLLCFEPCQALRSWVAQQALHGVYAC
ncbi:MAG: hypothetical protein AB4426_34170 [Xenococcaceae cyanobacterium]